MRLLAITMCLAGLTLFGHLQDTAELKVERSYYCKWLDEEITQDEFDLICRTTYCEAGGDDWNAQVMVALTILNRWGSGYADTVTDVVYQKNAYAVTRWKDFENREWSEKTRIAVQFALDVNTHPRDMYYFRDGHYHNFGRPYIKVGSLYFSTAD